MANAVQVLVLQTKKDLIDSYARLITKKKKKKKIGYRQTDRDLTLVIVIFLGYASVP